MMTKDEDLFSGIIGQSEAKLAIKDWFFHETQPLFIYGSSGYGKTLFAKSLKAITIDSTRLRSDRVNSILQPILESEDGDILFYDEVHSLQPKVLESLYQIIDTGRYYNADLGIELPIPNVRFIFASNIINKIPIAFMNRCRLVELQEYSEAELKQIIQARYPEISDEEGLSAIVRASKGVPRTAISYAKSVIAGAKTDKILDISQDEVNRILTTRMGIDPATGLSAKEHLIISKVLERGSLSMSGVANLLHTTLKDAQTQYIDKLRASEWLAVCSRGVIAGFKAHANYKLFIKRKEID